MFGGKSGKPPNLLAPMGILASSPGWVLRTSVDRAWSTRCRMISSESCVVRSEPSKPSRLEGRWRGIALTFCEVAELRNERNVFNRPFWGQGRSSVRTGTGREKPGAKQLQSDLSPFPRYFIELEL